MEYIAHEYPNLTNLVTRAKTFEGRPIRFLRISTTKFKDASKPIIIIEGGQHGREWISPPTVTWAIRKLTEHVTEPDLVNFFDWILMPVANPDGYVHTFSGVSLNSCYCIIKHPKVLFIQKFETHISIFLTSRSVFGAKTALGINPTIISVLELILTATSMLAGIPSALKEFHAP